MFSIEKQWLISQIRLITKGAPRLWLLVISSWLEFLKLKIYCLAFFDQKKKRVGKLNVETYLSMFLFFCVCVGPLNGYKHSHVKMYQDKQILLLCVAHTGASVHDVNMTAMLCWHKTDGAAWRDIVVNVTLVNIYHFFILLPREHRCQIRRRRLFTLSPSFSAVILGSGSYK